MILLTVNDSIATEGLVLILKKFDDHYWIIQKMFASTGGLRANGVRYSRQQPPEILPHALRDGGHNQSYRSPAGFSLKARDRVLGRTRKPTTTIGSFPPVPMAHSKCQ